ncbi:hypothetical protein MPH_07638 [Macrophomina phaseolina MS6]|uniref:Pentatricopeptide repeat domain-containing protein n=1 Tax=Macrophomina phaseolina (strain MS6) TaxID=1126212 RepID=K2QYY8_MACPH|nr:hypothetical protein MPH_07638 [Macrophomina phaseolina MS6]
MRTALDRLLARPSILRALRFLIAQEDISFAAVSPVHHRAFPSGVSHRHSPILPRAHTTPASPPANHPLAKCAFRSFNTASSAASLAPSEQTGRNPEDKTLERWVEVLQFHQRLYGNDGVKRVWKELRAGRVDLPTTGPWARPLWETFLAHDDLIDDVIAYAEDSKSRTSSFYEPLYESVIGRCFVKRKHRDVYRWHAKLASTFPPGYGALRRISSKIEGSRASISAFRYIYTRNDQRDVYDTLITNLCNGNRWSAALQCHSVLITRGDFPSGTAMDPSLASVWENLLRTAGKRRMEDESGDGTQDPVGLTFSRETMNRVLGEVHGVEPKKLDDHFCARIFATKAFSIDVIIRGLGMFGVDEIGPVALREMASRTVDAERICYNINKLNEAGISIGKSVYSQALQKFAEDGRQDLINSLLSTDQHPDALEDTALQRKLLSSFIEKGDWNEAHRTLAILTVFHRDPAREQWNMLVQKLSTLRDIEKLCKVLEDMQSRRVALTEGSMAALQVYQLRPRKPGNRPVMRGPGYNDTTLIANIWRSTLVSGGHVDPRRWAELFRRFGMTECFDDVVKLALWLADWYSQNGSSGKSSSLDRILENGKSRSSVVHLAMKPTDPRHPLRKIFSDKQLRAFIAWGIRRAFITPTPEDLKDSKKPPHFWAQGFRLSKHLRQRGVYVNSRTVRAELRSQLVRLFGHGCSNRLYNRRSVANNPYSILQMIGFANEVWMGTSEGLLLDPRELVSGQTNHFGLWWLKELRWEVLQEVDLALGSQLKTSLPRNEYGNATVQDKDEEPTDHGEVNAGFQFADDNAGADTPLPYQVNDADHMSVLGFRLDRTTNPELAKAEALNGDEKAGQMPRDEVASQKWEPRDEQSVSFQPPYKKALG